MDEIIHLGDFWYETGMRRNKEKILDINREVGRLFRRAYGYLAQAKILKAEIESYYEDSNSLDLASFNTSTRNLLEEIFSGASDQRRKADDRHLFASAITPKGPENFFGTLFDDLQRRFIIQGSYSGFGFSLAARIVSEASLLGYDTEVFHCALEPQRVEHVIIPGLKAALITNREPHTYSPHQGDTIINLDNFIATSKLQTNQADLTIAREHFSGAFNRAVSFISRAKAVHDAMEKYYIPNMDFDRINTKLEETLERVLAYAAEVKEAGVDTAQQVEENNDLVSNL